MDYTVYYEPTPVAKETAEETNDNSAEAQKCSLNAYLDKSM